LGRIGGLSPLVDYLADDYVRARRTHRRPAGYAVELSRKS